jgi:hypothetical protein
MIDIHDLWGGFDDREIRFAYSLGRTTVTNNNDFVLGEGRWEILRYGSGARNNSVPGDISTLVIDPNRKPESLQPLGETARGTVRVSVRINVGNDNYSRSCLKNVQHLITS